MVVWLHALGQNIMVEGTCGLGHSLFPSWLTREQRAGQEARNEMVPGPGPQVTHFLPPGR